MLRSIIIIIISTIFAEAAYASPIPAEKLFTNPMASRFDISPDGKFISYYDISDDKKKLLLLDIETMETQLLGPIADDETLNSYRWLDEKNLIVHVGGGKKVIKVLLNVSFNDDKKVKVNNHRIRSDGYIVASLGQQVLYAKRRDEDEIGYKLYRLSLADLKKSNFPKQKKLKYILDDAIRFIYDENTERLITAQYDEDTEVLTFFYKGLLEKQWTEFYKLRESKNTFSIIGFLTEGKLAILSNQKSDKTALYEFDIATQSIGKKLFEHSMYDLTDANIDYENASIDSVSYYDHGKYTVKYFSQQDKKTDLALKNALPSKQYYSVAKHSGKGYNILATGSATDPGQYYLYKQSSQEAEVLKSRHPQLENYLFSPSIPIKVQVGDQTTIEALLTQPAGFDNNALIVMPHGGPIGVRDNDFFNPIVQYFASRGFSILRVNFRGSTGYGKEFLESGVGQFGQTIENDISAVVDQVLAKHEYKKVCAMGASYGGYSSFMLSIYNPEIYDCVVASYGIYDLPLLFNSSNIKRLEDHLQRVENTVGKLDKALFNVSPVYLANKIQVPSLVIGGLNDKIAGFEQTHRMTHTLELLNKNVDSIYYNNTGHGHYYFYGDWHENAYIYQFLQSTLDLPDTPYSDVSEEDKELLMKETVRLADSFTFEDKVPDDEVKSIKFYTQAMEQNHPRSIHNMASFYETGEGVEKDIDKAISLYKKASELEYSGASLALANLFFEDDSQYTDFTKAISYYELAKKQKHDASVNLFLAQAYCLGKGVDKDVKRCVELLDLKRLDKDGDNKVTSKARNKVKEMFSKALGHGSYNAGEMKLFREFASKNFSLNFHDVEVTVRQVGKYGKRDLFNLMFEDVEFMRPELGLKFGVKFDVVPTNTDNKRKKTGIYGIWRRLNADGSFDIRHSAFAYGGKRNWQFLYALSEEDLEARKWELTLYDLYNKEIYKKSFKMEGSLAETYGQ